MSSMNVKHLGLRAQIMLSLATLLVVVFGFTSISFLWVLRASLSAQQREFGMSAAEVIVQGVAHRMRSGVSEGDATRVIEPIVGTSGIVAMGVYDSSAQPVTQRTLSGGDLDLGEIDPRRPRPFRLTRERADGRGDEVILVHPIGHGRGSVVAVVSLQASGVELRRMARPLLIYLFTAGILLLGFGYFALTTLIVRPLEILTRATEQVAQGRLDVTVPLSGGREIAGAAAAFNFMTKRIKEQKTELEEHLRELETTTGELKATQAQLVQSARLASVGSLAAGVAHEVGNPVSAIMGLAEVLQEGELEGDEETEYVERIRKEAERVNRIIRDLLEYARPTPDQEEMPGSIAEAVDAAVGLLSPQKTFRDVTVQVMLDEGLPPVRPGTDQLTQIMVNLLMNAADAMDGEGDVRIRAESLEDDERVHVQITDSGPGVPEEELDHIFEPFYSTKDPGSGTGLGLALCEGIITRERGTVSATNSKHSGLTVNLILTRVTEEDDEES